MNNLETNKLAKELEKLGFDVEAKERPEDNLRFANKNYNGLQEYRDKDKNLCRLAPYFHIWFGAGVWPNGVGDGKKPEKALTYSIGFCNPGSICRYRCKEFYSQEHLKYYNYSRNLKTLIEDFKKHLVEAEKIICLFCGENMEAKEKLEDYHLCPPTMKMAVA